MSDARQGSRRTFTRNHAFVLAALLCYGVMTFIIGWQAGRRNPSEALTQNRTAEVVSETLLRSLTRPTAREGAFQPDPLEAFMEVYEQLKSKYVEDITDTDKKRLSYGAIRGMLRELGDPYTRFMEPEDFGDFQVENQGHFKGIGAMLGIDHDTHKIQVIQVFPDHPAAKAGLRPGDFIIAIDGEETADMSLEVAVQKIRGAAGTTVRLTVEAPQPETEKPDPELLKKLGRDPDKPRTDPLPVVGETRDLEITRGDIEFPIVEETILAGDIGYIQLTGFNEKAYQRLKEALADTARKGAKAWLLDLRHNPGGMLEEVRKITSLFIKDGPVVFVQERQRAAETLSVLPQYKYEGAQLPMVVLVDHYSASASEILAGALQDDQRAKILGETTYGKGLVQTVVPLSDNSAVAITTAKYLTPAKRDINKKGIEPDIPLKGLNERQRFEGLASGKPRDDWDPQVKKGVELLHEQLR